MASSTGIYRITDYRNLPFILDNGLHCANAGICDNNFIQIGFPTLINLRTDWPVPVEPRGVLGDYVPFYFTVKSPMLYVIYMHNDPEVVGNQDDIIYLIGSIEKIIERRIPFVFTDRNARLVYAAFYNQYEDLKRLNWEIIKSAQWGRQYGSDRLEIKHAEFLIHRHLPVEAILGIGCKTQAVYNQVEQMLPFVHARLQRQLSAWLSCVFR